MGVFFLNWLHALQGPTRNLLLRTTLFVVYLLAGSAVFQALESKQVVKERQRFEDVKYYMKTSYGINESELNRFIFEVKEALEEGFYDVDYERWGFMGSLFFTATVITTIGYGHMTPKTVGGQLFCIFYAFFGIPLTGLMLKSIGERLMDGIDSIFRAFDKRFLHRDVHSTNVRTSILLFTIMIIMIIVLAALAVCYEGWSFFEGIYFAFITLSTIGFGDLVPSHPSEKFGHDESQHYHVALFVLVTFIYITVGLSVVSSVLLSVTRIFENKTAWDFVSLENDSDDDELMVKKDFDTNLNRYGGTSN
ncbi:potassium channel subfamily K member 3-like [Rhopilema esculentum]|uniref:potassium channel subfamily K member 3-like n=1 Tax=Rhopilema esculentum TaxID=499914 RepID=UPI0031D20B5A